MNTQYKTVLMKHIFRHSLSAYWNTQIHILVNGLKLHESAYMNMGTHKTYDILSSMEITTTGR